ncbi:MAG: DUF6165 family protein [Pseudomonadota bacterium]
MTLKIDVAPGELIDKITILEIKSERISDQTKRTNVQTELTLLLSVRDSEIAASEQLTRLTTQLKSVNETLWEIEDAIRDCEKAQSFDAEFIRLARAVYQTNDRRAQIKREINLALGSTLIEEKSYQPY